MNSIVRLLVAFALLGAVVALLHFGPDLMKLVAMRESPTASA